MQSCYSTKPVPSWAHSGALISSLESLAEGYASPWSTRAAPQATPQAHQHHAAPAAPQMQARVQHAALPVSAYSSELISHGTLHSSGANTYPTLWNLASPFSEDTSSGALSAAMGGSGAGPGYAHNVMERKDSMQASGLGLGVLDMIERDQRARGY